MPIARSGPYIRSSLVRDNCIWWLLWRLPLHSQIPKHNVWSLRISPRKHDEFQNCSKHHNQRTNVTLVTSVTAIKVTTSTQILLASGYSWVYAAPRGKDNIESDNESQKKIRFIMSRFNEVTKMQNLFIFFLKNFVRCWLLPNTLDFIIFLALKLTSVPSYHYYTEVQWLNHLVFTFTYTTLTVFAKSLWGGEDVP